MIHRIVLLLLGSSLITLSPAPAADIYLVRHAEKVNDGSRDPDLTDVGRQRAANLALVLKSAGIEKIYTSDYRRTRETAVPLAEKLGLEVEIYDPRALEPLAAKLLQLEENALVVGHSNTTPELADLMGGDGGSPIVEAWEYDRLYLLHTENGRVTRTILLHVPPRPPRPNRCQPILGNVSDTASGSVSEPIYHLLVHLGVERGQNSDNSVHCVHSKGASRFLGRGRSVSATGRF